MNYRQVFAPGASYFFTLTLQDRRSDLLIRNIKELRIAFQQVMKSQPFTIDGIVVLPEHMHITIISQIKYDFVGPRPNLRLTDQILMRQP